MVLSSFLKNGKDLVTKKQDTILSAALVIMIATIATKILGVIKLVLLAHNYGTSRTLDIFYAANTLPEIIFNIFVIGSLNTALIPVLSECLGSKNSKKIWKIFNSILGIACIFLFILGLIGIIFAPQIVNILINLNVTHTDQPFTPSDLILMTYMIRILFISPVILGISFLISGILLVHKRFLITQVASILYTVGFIISIFIFVPIMGPIGLCWGVVLGSVLHLIVQLPVLKFLGMKFSWSIDWKENRLKKIGFLMAPRVLGLAGEQIGVFVDTVLSLGLLTGSLAAFEYANTYYIFPVALVGWSFSQAAFPTLSDEYSSGNKDSFKKNFIKTFQQILYLILPLCVIFLILRLPLVRLLGLGKDTQFFWQGTIITAWVLLFFALSIIFQSILSLLIRAFYAMHDSITPVKVSVITLIINIFLSIYLVKLFSRFDETQKVLNLLNLKNYLSFSSGNSWMAVGGLAAASTISAFIGMTILFIILSKRIEGFGKHLLWIPLLKKMIATFVMGGVMYALYKTLDIVMNTTKTLELIFLLGITCYVGISIYVLITFLLEDEEIEFVYKFATRIKGILYSKKNMPAGVVTPIVNSNEEVV